MSSFPTQQEADALLALEKHDLEKEQFSFPGLGGSIRIPLWSEDKHEEFMLDVTRGYIKLEKNTFQTRSRKTIILARLDIDGSPHRNPDGEEIGTRHLHLYREGFADKWAYPLPDAFTNTNNILTLLDEFMDYTHIVTKPIILPELWT